MAAAPAQSGGHGTRWGTVPPSSGRAVVLLTGALWLACLAICWALLATPVTGDNTGMMKLTESYGALERVALWQRTLDWFPGGGPGRAGAIWPKPAIVWTVRLAMTAMFALQALAFAVAWRSRQDRPWRWLIGAAGAQAIMLLMVPSNADVFFYAISGDIANGGLNPYNTRLYEVFEHPLYPYNHWVDMTTVYGPVWTLIDQVVMAIAGDDPARAVLAFKLLLGVVAIGITAGVYGTARMLGVAHGRATAAMVLVGWQPNLIIESAGQAHNDDVVIGLMLAGITLTIAGAGHTTRGGIVLLTLSAAVKYVSLPVLGLLALTRLAWLRATQVARLRAARTVLLDGVAAIAVIVAVFAPWWNGWSVLGEMVSEPGRLYTNPLWHAPASIVAVVDAGWGESFEDITRAVAQVAAVLAILIVMARFGASAWRATDIDSECGVPAWTRPLLAAWAAIFAILAFVPVNTHAWYWTWPVVPIALLVAFEEGDMYSAWPRPRWLLPYLLLTAILTLIYHTRIVHPG